MAKQERWYFTKAELENSPSRKCGIDSEKELSYRQQAANLIQDMGQKLKVAQLVINTAIVYMHRFYTFHSFSKFHRNAIAACALFLAAKVEEQPRKLEHVIKISQLCIFRETLDIKSEQYQTLASELVYHENLMLRTLGFDLSVQHPHTSVVKCCQLVRANKDMAQTSYFMATNSLHLTTMCLQYRPTVVACICIYFVCKWANFELPRSVEGKDWWTYVDLNVTQETLEQLTAEFIAIFQNCPSRLKKLLSASQANKLPNSPSLKQIDDKKNPHHESKNDSSKAEESTKHSPKDTSKSHHPNSRLFPNKAISKDLNKKDYAFKPDDQSSSKQVTKHSNNQSNSVPSAETQLLNTKETNSNQQNSSKNDEKSIPKDSTSNSFNFNASFDKTKQNLSVIASNPLTNSNNCTSYSESFFDSQTMFSCDSNDYTDFSLKKEISALKMEFSDNEDSNPSDNNISLTSTLMMNDSNDSKSLPNSSLAPIQNFDFKMGGYQASVFNSVSKATQPQPSSLLNNMFPSNPLAKTQFKDSFSKNETDFLSEKSTLNNKPITTCPTINASLKKTDPSKSSIMDSNLSNSSTNVHSIINSLTDPKSTTTAPSNISKLIPNESNFLKENSQPPITNASLSRNLQPSLMNDLDETSNQSRNSKHHKEKHKHKEKHRHKEKHKHKHKHKDKDKSRDKYNIEQPSFQVSISPTSKDNNQPAPIKLKISKQKLSIDDSDKTPELKPIKLKISLSSHQRSSSESPDSLQNTMKRKFDDKSKSGRLSNEYNDIYYPSPKVSKKT